ncbi:MAG: hypothetical protein Q9162_002177 [Coniocarpon cinnabarinum]
MAITYLILLSRQGKVRLAKWFTTLAPKEKAKIVKDVTQLVLARRTRMCNFLEYKDSKIVYRRYASLFFIAGCSSTDNELITLEIVHRYVEQMDKYYGNVCELDIIFNFQKAYFILDELLLAGEMQESSKKNVLRSISQQDNLEDMETVDEMKYLASRELEGVTSALNFDTNECHVSGACDLYITKAASRDKKLYRDIETTLENQHSSLVRFSKSLSPPHRELLHLHISNTSPFGPMDKNSSRRAFAYLIATMNASHTDYDFTDITKPSDFRQERNLSSVMNVINETMYNLRPRTKSQLLAPPLRDANGPNTPGGSHAWNQRCWKSIDKEMTLKECEVYKYAPEEDPFDGDDSAIWSHHYFFFNRHRKRVLYLFVRGLSILSHSPSQITTAVRIPVKRARPTSSYSLSYPDAGASKRAKYWLGDRATDVEDGWTYHDDDDVIEDPGDDEVDVDEWLESEPYDAYTETDDDEIEACLRGKNSCQGMR